MDIKELLENLKKEMGIEEDIKLRVVPMKQKIASLSLDKKVLRLNKEVVEKLSEDEIRYVLLHELVHLKVKDVNHGSLFLEELEKYLDLDKTWEIEVEMVKKLIPEKAFNY